MKVHILMLFLVLTFLNGCDSDENTSPQTVIEAIPDAKKLEVDTRNAEPTKAIDSSINMNNISTKGYTSVGLTKADFAWHAVNTYGFDCEEVISKRKMTEEGYFLIECSSGINLNVYLRNGMHPLITETK